MIAALVLAAAVSATPVPNLDAQIAADQARLSALYQRQNELLARRDLAGAKVNLRDIDALSVKLNAEQVAAYNAATTARRAIPLHPAPFTEAEIKALEGAAWTDASGHWSILIAREDWPAIRARLRQPLAPEQTHPTTGAPP